MKTKTILLLFLTLQISAQTFTEVSQSIGIEVLHEGKQHLGGGAAFFDCDQRNCPEFLGQAGRSAI